MIIRQLKLKLTKKQESALNEWLWNLTGVYNWAIRKVELDAKDGIYWSKFNMLSFLSSHSKRMMLPSHTIQSVVGQAHNAWERCFKRVSQKPKLKSVRNKLNSIPFPDLIPKSRITNKTIKLPILGKLRYFKQDLPGGSVKNARIIKRASGWYCILTIDTVNKFPVKKTEEKIGIDTGFKHLAILSDGTKIENQRNFVKSQKRLAQAQRGKNKKLTARLHERIKNRRNDYNHKISRKIVENYKEIYITKDNLRNQAKIFGKSVQDAGISKLRNFIIYKGDIHNRIVKLVNSKNTTMTCSKCGSLTGPTGLSKLNVRVWECSSCGEVLDRDINSANVILKLGLGYSLVNQKLLGES